MSVIVSDDREFGGNELYVDLIPKCCHGENLRKYRTGEEWNIIRQYIYARANYTCEICGISKVGTASYNPQCKIRMDCHERFEYIDGVQKLKRLMCLCQHCHQATHILLCMHWSKGKYYYRKAQMFLMGLTGMSVAQMEEQISEAKKLCAERGKQRWKLDLSVVKMGDE